MAVWDGKRVEIDRRTNPAPFLIRARVRNYKSIGNCEVRLAPLTVLSGRNGAGKSNFLDALAFVVDALRSSLDYAIQARGGVDEVRRRSTGHPRNFSIELELQLPQYRLATYGFEIAAASQGGFVVRRERVQIRDHRGAVVEHYLREGEAVDKTSVSSYPPVLGDRLYLVNAAGLPEFRPVYDALLAMGFYNLNPEVIKELQSPDAGELLRGDGRNAASVISRLSQQAPESLERICRYLGVIVPGITDVRRVALGPKETIEFRQEVAGAQRPWKFYAASMSDGTLRALGALVAAHQTVADRRLARLIGLEEPETALHPAAAGALVESLREATAHTQVLITSHSADLLDELELDRDALLVVAARGGTTYITPTDAASREAIRTHLYKPGELLRMDQLQLDEGDLARQELQESLFDPTPVLA